jgi:crotonobetaine/carnitine-CoA ligase
LTYEIANDLAATERTLPRIWDRRVRADPDSPFLWYPGRANVSAGEFDRSIAATAAGLHARDVQVGARVCLLMRNSPEMLEVMIALWRLGAVVVPFSPQLEGQLLTEKIEEIAPALLVADSSLADRIPAGLIEEGRLLINFVPGEQAAGGGGAVSLEEIRRPASHSPAIDVAPEAPALILFTSGTSGRSKGCVISHHYAVYYAWVFWRYMRYEASDTLYTCLPLNHCHALFASFWPGVLAGARLAISERFSASRFWREIVDSEATACTAIGTMTSILLAREPEEHDTQTKIRIAHVSADGALDMPRFEERFGFKTVTCLYGSTEAMVFPPMLDMPPISGLIGPPPTDWDVALMDERGYALEGVASGELVVRPRLAHTMFDGYYGLPEATLATRRGLWFHTGDLARRDGIGMYWFVGRSSDTIRRRGENVSSWEVERAIVQHPLVEEVAAFPLPSALSGNDVCVVVVSRSGSDLDVASLAAHCEAELPRYMRPDHIWVRDHGLPKNAGGKADKARLREEYARDTADAQKTAGAQASVAAGGSSA